MSGLWLFVVCAILSIASSKIDRYGYGGFPMTSLKTNDWQYDVMPLVKRNRMCLINAGLSQGCDLSDILMAKHQLTSPFQAHRFMSFAGPGRRYDVMPLGKRNRMYLINAGLSQGCDLSDIRMAKHQAHRFMSFAGPGRR